MSFCTSQEDLEAALCMAAMQNATEAVTQAAGCTAWSRPSSGAGNGWGQAHWLVSVLQP